MTQSCPWPGASTRTDTGRNLGVLRYATAVLDLASVEFQLLLNAVYFDLTI